MPSVLCPPRVSWYHECRPGTARWAGSRPPGPWRSGGTRHEPEAISRTFIQTGRSEVGYTDTGLFVYVGLWPSSSPEARVATDRIVSRPTIRLGKTFLSARSSYLGADLYAPFQLCSGQIVLGLQIEPKLGRVSEETTNPYRRVRGDGSFSAQNINDPARRHTQ